MHKNMHMSRIVGYSRRRLNATVQQSDAGHCGGRGGMSSSFKFKLLALNAEMRKGNWPARGLEKHRVSIILKPANRRASARSFVGTGSDQNYKDRTNCFECSASDRPIDEPNIISQSSFNEYEQNPCGSTSSSCLGLLRRMLISRTSSTIHIHLNINAAQNNERAVKK